MSTPTAESLESPRLQEQRRGAAFTAERPWGDFQQLILNQACTVKVITVEAGHRSPLQKHGERDETWQVLDVLLDVRVVEKCWTAQIGEIVYTPARSLHRLGNSADKSGRILEIALGRFNESDIERHEDDYARPGTYR